MKNILITGATGYLGSLLTHQLSTEKTQLGILNLVATDVREPKNKDSNVIFEKLDVRQDQAEFLFKKYNINCVIHLASIVTPGKNSSRDFEYSVDVLGTENIINACLSAKVKRVIISSSGAAYGYYPENEKPLVESDPIRGNEVFAYSHHKKLVEQFLEKISRTHPEIEFTIFRITTILGEKVNNQITALFKKPIQIGIYGTESCFSFIWDIDAVNCIQKSIFSEKTGIYNLSGDGSVSIKERGQLLKKPILKFPSFFIEASLFILKKLGLTQYGPEQTLFLKYRPILNNQKLKSEFNFIPQKTSLEVFKSYISGNW